MFAFRKGRLIQVALFICTLLAGSVSYGQDAPADLKALIRTPPTPETPRVNGPTIFGVRPGSPFLYKIPATGKKPIRYSVTDLPKGLKVDAKTGIITGKLSEAGESVVTLIAKNDLGTAKKKFKIVVGETIALTPPLGWNSWNAFKADIRGQNVIDAAKTMVDKGLIDHGWTYINIDDAWQSVRGGQFNGIQPNEKFPDFEKMCTDVHKMGLKFGIYSGPCVRTYAGYVGSSSDYPDGAWIGKGSPAANPTPLPAPPADFDLSTIPAEKRPAISQAAAGRTKKISPAKLGKYTFAVNDAKQFAAWGVDYLKYDWNSNEVPEVKEMADALRASGRDIIYSLSNSTPFANIGENSKLANAWRITGDISDSWQSMASKGFGTDRWAPFNSPGHWNDPDMMVVGWVNFGGYHPTRLTPDEQYTHVTLWALVDSPMLLGCDMTKLDEFTLNLLTNDEVLAVSQDALGKQAVAVNKVSKAEAEPSPLPAATPAPNSKKKAGKARPAAPTGVRVYAKPLEDGTMAIGLFNLDKEPKKVTANWSDLQLSGSQPVRDLWRQKDLGSAEEKFEMTVAPHGAELLKIGKPKAE